MKVGDKLSERSSELRVGSKLYCHTDDKIGYTKGKLYTIASKDKNIFWLYDDFDCYCWYFYESSSQKSFKKLFYSLKEYRKLKLEKLYE